MNFIKLLLIYLIYHYCVFFSKDDQNYLTMETKFLTRTRIPNAVLMDKRSV